MGPDAGDLTLVLIHGAGAAGAVWQGVVEHLAGRWPALAPDLPGHGGAAGPGRDSIGGYASWLEAFLASRVDGPVVLGGHSMGGAIALETALRGRVELAGLVLVDTGARLRVVPELLAGLERDFEPTLHQLGDFAFSHGVDPELRRLAHARAVQAGPETVHADFVACDGFDVTGRLHRLALPTLVICGVEDRMTPLKYSQFLAGQIPSARLEPIEQAGHEAPAEQPAAVAAAIEQFLEELE